MSTTFPHFYTALQWTLEYYSTYRIKNEMERLNGKGYGGANYKRIEEFYELVFTLQARMEEEIVYTIQNCYAPTQLIHLTLLKDWLEDYRIEETNYREVAHEINSYNNNLYDKFLSETIKQEEEFRSKEVYKLEHGQEYQYKEPTSISPLIMSAFLEGYKILHHQEYKDGIAKNNKFFCLEKTPEYIDDEFILDYFQRLDKMISNFRRILKKYVAMWDDGKLPIYQNTVILHQKEEIKISENLPEPLAKPHNKLKVNLSVEQLAYLFRLMKDENIIESESNIEIHEFISKNFETHKTGKTKDISTNKLASSFSTPEKSVAKSLIPILKNMFDKAAKI